jgi:hypothetical protein
MRKMLSIFVIFLASVAMAQRAYVPKVSPSETPVLEDGEVVVGTLPDGEPVQLRVGDGSTSGGRVLYDSRTAIRMSPLGVLAEQDYSVTLSGSAYWANGVISLFTPSTEYSTAVTGLVTIALVATDKRIQSVQVSETGTDYTLTTTIAADGQSATLRGTMRQSLTPGDPEEKSAYIETITVNAYAERSLVGGTNDLRAMSTLIQHPAAAAGRTNVSDYLPMSMGYYQDVVQDAVSAWSTHPATNRVTLSADMDINDGRSLQQRFAWRYRPNGYLTLQHESDTNKPVMSIEAMDPYPWLITDATGHVSTLEFTTNGLAGDFLVRSSTNLVLDVWADAPILATNTAPAGYMSLTASNTLGGSRAYFKVVVSNAVQAASLVNFGLPVQVQGHAVLTNPAAFATAAQGSKADAAAVASVVATQVWSSTQYPLALTDAGAFATAAQGARADLANTNAFMVTPAVLTSALTVTVTRASVLTWPNGEASLTLTNAVYLTVSGFATNDAGTFAVSVTGTNAVTFDTNSITGSADLTWSTTEPNDLIFRKARGFGTVGVR